VYIDPLPDEEFEDQDEQEEEEEEEEEQEEEEGGEDEEHATPRSRFPQNHVKAQIRTWHQTAF
jgi:hypothetical protein